MNRQEKYQSVFIDTLPAPTHLFSGIAPGNIASEQHKFTPSFPKKAALESLYKMKRVVDLGYHQLVTPPIPRPDFSFLKSLGYRAGLYNNKNFKTTADFRRALSSSNMWTANWAHITPSCDTTDHKLHVTVANLGASTHRFLEHDYTFSILNYILHNMPNAIVHKPLPASLDFHDEGAANDIRLSDSSREKGFFTFVWGRNSPINPKSHRYQARQTKEAYEAILRRHKILDDSYIFLEQNPEAIDAGVFHNDVISFGALNLFICHELAFVDQKRQLDELQAKFHKKTGSNLLLIEIPQSLLSLEQAVSTYFFNSELLPPHNSKDGFRLLLPEKVDEVMNYVQKKAPFISMETISLSESMKNGGGPACLRLELLLSKEERDTLPKNLFLTESLYRDLEETIEALYPNSITVEEILTNKETLLSLLHAEEAISILLGMHSFFRRAAKKIGLGRYLSKLKSTE